MPRAKSGRASGRQSYRGKKQRHPLRATLLIMLILASVIGGLYSYARWIEPRRLAVEHLTVSSPLVTQTHKIAVVADLHIGRDCGAQRVAQIMNGIAELKPDMVVFLGDFFDDYSKYTEGDEALITEIVSLPQLPKAQKYAVWGNHDFGGGAMKIYPKIMKDAGWTLLQNDSLMIDGNINLIGADDLIWGTPDVQKQVRDGAFNLLLCHEPDYADEVTGVQLQLSGHTHGLQINLPLDVYRNRIAPPGGRHYLSGKYEKADGSIIYVNRGIGMSLMNYRFAAIPEITLVEVTP